MPCTALALVEKEGPLEGEDAEAAQEADKRKRRGLLQEADPVLRARRPVPEPREEEPEEEGEEDRVDDAGDKDVGLAAQVAAGAELRISLSLE